MYLVEKNKTLKAYQNLSRLIKEEKISITKKELGSMLSTHPVLIGTLKITKIEYDDRL